MAPCRSENRGVCIKQPIIFNMKNTKQLRATFLLLLTAVIWGLAFVAQEVGAEYLGTFSFNGIRFLLGAASLLPVVLFFERERMTRAKWKKLLLSSLAAGTVLFSASARSFQPL